MDCRQCRGGLGGHARRRVLDSKQWVAGGYLVGGCFGVGHHVICSFAIDSGGVQCVGCEQP